MNDSVESALAPDDVRDILAAAADVMFSDGIPAELLDQWTAETYFLLSGRYPSPGSSKR